MDFKPPDCALAALVQVAGRGQLRYVMASESTRAAVVHWFARRHGWSLSERSILLLPFGPKAGIRLLLHALANLDRPLIALTPMYSGVTKVARHAGLAVVECPLLEDQSLRSSIDMERLADDAVRTNAGTLLLCSPHNPVGRVWTADELAQIGELAARLGLLVLSDEVHADLVHPPSIHTPYGRTHWHTKWASIHGVGKTFNLSGIPWSFAVLPSRQAREQALAVLSGWGYYEGSLIGDAVAAAVLREGEDWLDNCRATLFERVTRARSVLGGLMPRVRSASVEAGFLLWVRADSHSASLDIAADIYQEAGVRVLDGRRFGAKGGGYFRMNVAVESDVLEEALTRLSRFFGDSSLRGRPPK